MPSPCPSLRLNTSQQARDDNHHHDADQEFAHCVRIGSFPWALQKTIATVMASPKCDERGRDRANSLGVAHCFVFDQFG